MQELEAVKGKVEQLTAERDKAMAENFIARQQRDCHADHAQLLTRDNKRLLTQLQALRSEGSARELKLAKAIPQASLRDLTTHNRASESKRQGTSGTHEGKQLKVASNAAERTFKGEDIKNTLHKEPFNLSRTISTKSKINSQRVLEQVQQLRLPKH